jgi:hypothetical protein
MDSQAHASSNAERACPQPILKRIICTRFGGDAKRRQTTQQSVRGCDEVRFLMAGGVVPRGLLIDRGVSKKVRDWCRDDRCGLNHESQLGFCSPE